MQTEKDSLFLSQVEWPPWVRCLKNTKSLKSQAPQGFLVVLTWWNEQKKILSPSPRMKYTLRSFTDWNNHTLLVQHLLAEFWVGQGWSFILRCWGRFLYKPWDYVGLFSRKIFEEIYGKKLQTLCIIKASLSCKYIVFKFEMIFRTFAKRAETDRS